MNILKYLLAFFLTLEILLRLVSHKEENIIYFFHIFPVAKTRSSADWDRQITKLSNHPYSKYDSLTGWSYIPRSRNPKSGYHFNDDGLRGETNYGAKNDDVLRIALFGSSFVLSAEVADTQTLSFLLEKELNGRGIKSEVLNFGVGGYGTDQSYLLWKTKGRKYKPDLVLFGFLQNDCLDNINIFKPYLYPESRILYSKPRAYIDADSLRWSNYPTLRAEELQDSLLIHFEQSSFYPHEYFREQYRTEKTFGEYFYTSLLVNKLLYLLNPEMYLKNNPEAQEITFQLLKQFEKEVKAIGSEFIVVQIPNIADVVSIKMKNKLPYAPFMGRLDDTFEFWRTDTLLSKTPVQAQFSSSYQHFSADGNRRLARIICNRITYKAK